jgi:surface carbohydrate biosynthesis protein
MEYLEPWNPEVLYVRGEEINMKVLLKSLFKGGSREDAYVDCFIEEMRPHLVVTFNDNHSGFHAIAKRNPDIVTLFIQNGLRDTKIFERLARRKSLGDSLKVDYMMTHCDFVGSQYAEYIQGCSISMGSVRNNHVPKLQNQQQGMMIFVSQWEICVGDHRQWKNYFESVHAIVFQCLMNYAKKKGKRLTILLRNYKNTDLLSQEKAHFRDLMGCEPDFYESKGSYSSYQAVDSAEVVVTLSSTLGFESIARGNKTAHFNIDPGCFGYTVKEIDTRWLGDFPDEGPFWTNNPNPDNMVRILDYLFEVDDVQWDKDMKDNNFSSLMVYDPGNTLFKSILDKELGPPPRTKNIATSVQNESAEAER